MSKELVHFENFAKLKDTHVAFNDITVIAGKPGTGKSYVMKMMYALDETFYRKSIDKLVHSFVDKQKNRLNTIAGIFLADEKELLSQAQQFVQNDDFLSYKELIKGYFQKVNDLENVLDDTIKTIENIKNLDLSLKMKLFLSNVMKSIFSDYHQISDKFYIGTENVKIFYENDEISFEFKNILSIDTSTVVFVETPLILEFKKFITREEGKAPYHLESLLNILDTDYSFTDEEQDKFINKFTQKSQRIIEGDIENSGDSFVFNKKGEKSYDIVNASSGIKSIGLLQYLVANKALKKDSVLYWEEPEVHLHPEWQLRMIELFVELMHAGVKIVFSTHSPYMCDYLNAISQKKGFNDRVSFNLFEEIDGVVNNHILESDEAWNKIQAELLDPLEEIMWEYI